MTITRETFDEYLDALDRVDADALTTRFYHADFSAELNGEQVDATGLLEFEQLMLSLAEIHTDVHQLVIDEFGIAMDAVRTFTIREDADVPIIGAARKGERWGVRINAFYTLRDGLIATIRPNVISVDKAR